MIITIPRGGRAVLLVWAALPGAAAAPFFFWQGPGAGALFCAAWAALMACLWMRAASLTAVLEPAGCLTVSAGVAFRTRRTLAPGSVTGVGQLSTPLLRRAGCCLLVLRTQGGLLFLPALPAAAAQGLCALLQRSGPAASGQRPGPAAGQGR